MINLKQNNSWLSVFVLCCVAIFANSCGFRSEPSAKQVLSNAFASLSGKTPDWKKAKALAEKAVKLDPKDHRAKILLAAAYEQCGQISSAVDELKKAIKIAPNDFHAQFAIGRIYFESGKYADALTPLVNACKIEPQNGAAVFYLARTYYKLKQIANARSKYLNLAKLPDFKNRPEPFNELGVIFLEEKNYKEAFRAFMAANNKARDNHKIVWNLAVFYDVHARNPESAINFYEKYQQLTLVNPELAPRREVARQRIIALRLASPNR